MQDKKKFAIYVAEIYKEYHKLTGRDLEDIFTRYDVWSFVYDFFEILHINGANYIIEEIDRYIESKINS